MNPKKIILVHGMWGPGKFNGESQWKVWKDHFESAGYEVVVLVLPGHAGGWISWRTLGEYVKFVQEKVRIEGPCILLGHSMGGLIVQKVANLEPELVTRSILVESAPPRGVSALVWDVNMCILLQPFIWLAMIFGFSFKLGKNWRRLLMMNCLPKDADPIELFPNRESGWAALGVTLGLMKVEKMTQKSLFIMGTDDRITPIHAMARVADIHGSRKLIHDGGHMPMVESDAKAIAVSIIKWVEAGNPDYHG